MSRDQFLFRKENQLKKGDKSLKGNWDHRIAELCNKINSIGDYYTTSSCSGRVVVLKDSKEKRDDLFVFVSHDEINIEQLKEALRKISGEGIFYFKQDPVIIHISCKTIENCRELINLALKSGWKRNGIISSNKRFVVELNSTEKLEFPIVKNGKILVDEEYLKLIVKEANKKLKRSWEKIDKLSKSL